jgi:hypothetical protein
MAPDPLPASPWQPGKPTAARNGGIPGPPITSTPAPPDTPRPAATPGFVPDDYLGQLEHLGTSTTATAAALCTLGAWERAGGGYRILDRELAGFALDAIGQRRPGEDPEALTGEHDHETNAWAFLARPVIITPRCAICGIDSTRVETIAPGQMPARWDTLPGIIQDGILQARSPGMWHLIAIGPAAGSLTASPSTLSGPARSPERCGPRSASPRSTRPASTTTPESATAATPPTATTTGTPSTPDTPGAPRGHGKSLDPDW